MKYLITVSCME